MDFVPLSGSVRDVPEAVRSGAGAIAKKSTHLTSTVSPQGSIRSDLLRGIVEQAPSPHGFLAAGYATFAPKEIHFTGVTLRTGVSIQAGRAFLNNAALVSVLAAASSPEIDWVIVVVPDVYKSSRVYPEVLGQLHELQGAHGVHLALRGVVLLSY